MSNIDINLIRALDGAAPQHKASNANKFELSEGSDGAQHVKIVDSEGNVQDKISVELPDKQIVTVDNQIQLPTDYPDKAVEARLQAIEQTQSQILDKLNDTIDTRLTGSIMDDVEAVPVKGRKLEWYASDGFSINIEPGGTYFFRDSDFLNHTDSFKDLSEYEYYYIGVQSETSHDFKAFTRSKLLGSVGISKDVIADG